MLGCVSCWSLIVTGPDLFCALRYPKRCASMIDPPAPRMQSDLLLELCAVCRRSQIETSIESHSILNHESDQSRGAAGRPRPRPFPLSLHSSLPSSLAPLIPCSSHPLLPSSLAPHFLRHPSLPPRPPPSSLPPLIPPLIPRSLPACLYRSCRAAGSVLLPLLVARLLAWFLPLLLPPTYPSIVAAAVSPTQFHFIFETIPLTQQLCSLH